jgi:hypothetical protein
VDIDLTKFLPDAVWEERQEELATVLIGMHGSNLEYIPSPYRTYELCLKAVGENGNFLKHVPVKFRNDRDITIAAFGTMFVSRFFDKKDTKICLKYVNDKSFQLDVVRKNGCQALENLINMQAKISNDQWMKFLEINPECIKHLPKSSQTIDMVRYIVTHCDEDTLHNLRRHINRSLIHKDLAMTLVGVKGFENLVEGKLKGREKVVAPEIGMVKDDEIIIDMTPAEYKHFS